MRWLALAWAALACAGCPPAVSDLCAGVTCAPGRACVGGVCINQDLPHPDLFPAPDAPRPSSDAAADAATADAVGAEASPDASTCSPGTKELVVKVHVEGVSYLRIQSNQAWWYHVAYTAPGRSTTPASPTTINNVAWMPTWPFGSGAGMHCVCESSKLDLCQAGVALGVTPKYSALTKISGPGVVAVVEVPGAGNGYRAVVLVNDTPYGSNWYEFKITFD